jgi:hypothetical protein
MNDNEFINKVMLIGQVMTELLHSVLVIFEALEKQGIVSREAFINNLQERLEQSGRNIFEGPNRGKGLSKGSRRQQRMYEKEIRILVFSPHIVKVRINRFTTVRQIIADLEKIGLKGFELGVEPHDFLFTAKERIFDKVDGIIYAFPTEGG